MLASTRSRRQRNRGSKSDCDLRREQSYLALFRSHVSRGSSMPRTSVYFGLCLLLAYQQSAKPVLGQHNHGQDPQQLVELGNGVQAAMQLEPEPHFRVQGIAAATVETGPEYFKIAVQTAQTDVPAILGRYERDGNTLVFFPRYPLSKNVKYQMLVGPRLQQAIDQKSTQVSKPPMLFQLPSQPPETPTTITAIYPSAAVLPVNLLKFYIYFSRPMSRGQAYQNIQLLHEGDIVEKPFLELGEELWDGEQTRFTLFIHPGRIKHGLKSRDEAGPVLTAGQHYTLSINQAWMDAGGFKLAQTFEKQFKIGPADESQLDPQKWKIVAPTNHAAPVVLEFDEPLDQAMLMRVFEIKHRDGSTIQGKVELAEQESQWIFTPAQPWTTGTYSIEVATILEDLCGNSLAKPFEAKMQLSTADQPARYIAIEFIVQ